MFFELVSHDLTVFNENVGCFGTRCFPLNCLYDMAA